MPIRSTLRFLLTLVAAAVALALLAGPAGAVCGGYPPRASTLTATPGVVDPGGALQVCGDAFQPGGSVSVSVTVDGTSSGSFDATADANGNFCADRTAPNDRGATVAFAADDGSCQAAAQVQVRVPTEVGGTQATNNQSNNLAFTGRTLGPVALLGALLVVAGVAFWAVGQRRSAPAS